MALMSLENAIKEVSKISLDDVPNLKSGKYPERVMLSLSSESYAKLKVLKEHHKKDTSEMIRTLIDRTLARLDL